MITILTCCFVAFACLYCYFQGYSMGKAKEKQENYTQFIYQLQCLLFAKTMSKEELRVTIEAIDKMCKRYRSLANKENDHE